MNILFNSQNYFVAEVPEPAGFEIVDKFTGKGAFIGGDMAVSMRASFQAFVDQHSQGGNTVSADEIDDFLRNYDALFNQRVVYH